MPTNADTLIVVFSRNYSTGLSVIRSLGAAGFTVDLVASVHKEGYSDIAAASKYVRRSVEIISRKVAAEGEDELEGEGALIDALLEYADAPEKRIVLFPVDDYTTSVMDAHRSELAPIFLMPGIEGAGDGALAALQDKNAQSMAAKSQNILAPREWVISLEPEQPAIPATMVYPCFVKPAESFSGYKSEMKRCNSADELRKHLRKLHKRNPNRSVVVQEFLQIDREIDVQGVCFGDQVIIPAIINKTNIAQYERGVTLAGDVAPVEELGDLYDKLIAMLQGFHYTGMFDLEINVVGGSYYFNEVNFRSGGPNYAYYGSGVNLPALFVNHLLGNPIAREDTEVSSFGKHFVYEKVAWDDYGYEYISKDELNAILASADIRLFHDDADPVPGQIFEKRASETAEERRRKRAAKRETGTSTRAKSGAKRGLKRFARKMKRRVFPLPQSNPANARDPQAPVARVMVVGRNWCSNLCLARAFGEAGYDVEVMRLFRVPPARKDLLRRLKPEQDSKYVKAFWVCTSQRKQYNLYAKLKKVADPHHKMLLVTADDVVASAIDNYYDRLKAYYIMPNARDMKGEINRLMEKSVQKRIFQNAGLPVLNSCLISTKDGAFTIPSSVTYPCFVKPNESRRSSKSRLRMCATEADLRAALTEFSAKRDISMLVEDYVEVVKEYSFLGVAAGGRVVCPALFVAEQNGSAEHKGVAASGRILPVSTMQDLADKVAAFVSELDYTGLFDIDLVETPDGRIIVLEMNLRFGASGYAFAERGANMPGMLADALLKKIPLDTSIAVEPDAVFVNERVLLDEYAQARISMGEYKRVLATGNITFVDNAADPGPMRAFKWMRKYARIMHLSN